MPGTGHVTDNHRVDEAGVTWDRRTIRCDPFDVTFDVPTAPDDVVRASAKRGDAERGYWAHLWGSSEVLARYVATTPLIGPGVRALEIGCGLGLVAVVAALRGATVIVTDREPPAVEAALHNAALNGVAHHITAAPFDWRHDPDPAWDPGVLLAADVVYKPDNARQIGALIKRLNCPAIMSEPNRTQSAEAPEVLRAMGLTVRITIVRGGRIITAG
jgi:predicted nicotinamide N-methyase